MARDWFVTKGGRVQFIDTDALQGEIKALQGKESALAERLAELESKPVAKASAGGGGGGSGGPYEPLGAVASHVAATNPHPNYALASALAWTAATLTIPASTCSHRETIAAPGITAAPVSAMLAAVGDEDENDPEMLDVVLLHAKSIPAAGLIEFLMTFSSPTRGPIRILYRSA